MKAANFKCCKKVLIAQSISYGFLCKQFELKLSIAAARNKKTLSKFALS